MPQETPETTGAQAPAATPEPSATASTTETQPTQSATPSTEVPADYEYNGDRNSVPEPLKKYVSSLDRYLTKKQQAFAEAEKKAKEWESFQSSEDFKTLQQLKANKGAPQATPTGTQPEQGIEPTEEEMDAIALGDKKALQSIIDRHVRAALDPARNQLESLAAKQQQAETAEMIKAFGEVHTDFWDIFEAYEPQMTAVLKMGTSLEDAYKAFKDVEARADTRADKRYKQSIEAKKNGSTVQTKTTGETDVVVVDNEREAMRLRAQFAIKGDPRTVQIKK